MMHCSCKLISSARVVLSSVHCVSCVVGFAAQAKFMCVEESPLSPAQVQFLSNEAFQSNIFQYCNNEFKKGIRSRANTQSLSSDFNYIILRDNYLIMFY